MKTENTCVNCVSLECCVRLNCEDNELSTEILKPENEDTNIIVENVVSRLVEKVIADK
jgi:hypothetical protein